MRSLKPLKIVVISTLGNHHRYVISRLLQDFEIECVLQPKLVLNPLKRSPFFNRIFNQGFFMRMINRFNDRCASRFTNELEAEAAQFLPADLANLRIESISVFDLMSSVGQDRLKSLSPDVLIAAGAPILSDQILSIARLGSINLHFGHIPAYRGQNNLFFALKHGDYENIAATIHHMNAVLDGGNLLSRARPSFTNQTPEVEVLAGCTQLAAIEFIQLLKIITEKDRIPDGLKVDPTRSKVYRFRDRNLFTHFQFKLTRFLAQLLKREKIKITEKIERFY